MTAWGFLKRRTVIAACGAALVAVVAIMVSLPPPLPRAALASIGAAPSATTRTNVGAATATAEPTATQPPPTHTPQPTPTPPIPGTTGQLLGEVTAVNSASSSLTLRHNGRSYTIVVDASTSYPGTAKNLGQIASGWSAFTSGVWQVDGSLLADPGLVNANPGDT